MRKIVQEIMTGRLSIEIRKFQVHMNKKNLQIIIKWRFMFSRGEMFFNLYIYIYIQTYLFIYWVSLSLARSEHDDLKELSVTFTLLSGNSYYLIIGVTAVILVLLWFSWRFTTPKAHFFVQYSRNGSPNVSTHKSSNGKNWVESSGISRNANKSADKYISQSRWFSTQFSQWRSKRCVQSFD